MRDFQPARAWAASVLTCACFLAAFTLIMHAIAGRWQHALHNVTDITVAFTAVFAFVAAVLYVPTFVLLASVLRDRLTGPLSVIAGAMLAPFVLLAVAMAFRESESPRTAWQWATYWVQNLPGVVIGLIPYAAAGAAFGFSGTRPPLRAADRSGRESRA
jgi:hypothetical protein